MTEFLAGGLVGCLSGLAVAGLLLAWQRRVMLASFQELAAAGFRRGVFQPKVDER